MVGSEALAAEAAERWRRGELVAFPTETVYGLGAAARDPAAVAKVFAAKGRPADHPLIVHLAAADAAPAWARSWEPRAARLAAAFWPGPLTLIVPRAADVPDAVTGGQDTVGLRVPNHALALALLEAFGEGVAAPSANRFGAVSPTTAAHVALELGDAVDLIVDGGPCRVGVESTIVDLSGEAARLLRPGGVPAEAIEEALGTPLAASGPEAPRAPGTLNSHYAPRAELRVVAPAAVDAALADALRAGRRVVHLGAEDRGAPRIALPASFEGAARRLYAALREVDAAGFELAVVALPEARGLGRAVADRLKRAAAPRE